VIAPVPTSSTSIATKKPEDDMTTTSTTDTANPAGLVPKAKEVMARIKAHNVVVIAAGIAFYGLLALIPTIVAVISVYALATDPADIASQIEGITENMEQASADFLNEQVALAVDDAKGSGAIALVIGILVALWAASGALQKLMNVIALAYGAIEGRGGLKVRGIAYGLTAGGILTVALIGFVFGALPPVLQAVGLGTTLNALVSVGSYAAMLLFMMFGFTVLYRYGPDRHPKTPWKNPGAVAGATMFLVFALLFSLYFRFAAGSLPASYSILGAIAAIIIFLQLTAIAVVIGAEVNAMNEDADIDPLAALDRPEDKKADPLSFGKAAAAIAALIVLGRG
jgi:membrane protein